jgi:hypothetical protein
LITTANKSWYAAAVGLVLLVGCQRPPSNVAPLAGPTPAETPVRLTGTNSCSGRACHGAAGPTVSTSVGNEFAIWRLHDKHAEAYAVLLGDRAKIIARNLGSPEGRAELDSRCLACHTNPRAALADAPEPLRAERAFGVGCESCHGPATKWLGPHTSLTWKKLSPQEKERDFGMAALGDLATRALVCAGCHVGAPAEPNDGIPARDLDHDLLAAGHPRSNFELGSFLANVPKHWVEKNRDPGFEARVWAVGQVASAQAALTLLTDRATDERRPWPQFADHDCYACHHDLHGLSWRQQRGSRLERPPGSLSLNPWYFSLLGQVPGCEPPAGLPKIVTLLSTAQSNRKNVATEARGAARDLQATLGRVASAHYDSEGVRTKLVTLAAEAVKHPPENWDQAEQLCLALLALNQAHRDHLRAGKEQPSRRDEKIEAALKEMVRKLAFPKGTDSPASFRRSPSFDEELAELLKQIAEMQP